MKWSPGSTSPHLRPMIAAWRRKALSFVRDEDAQAVTEYLLMMAIAAGLAMLLMKGIRRGVVGVWTSFAIDIVPPCPGCKPSIPLATPGR